MRMAIEKADAKGAFEVGNHVRYGWLGDAKLCRGFRHAAAFRHHEQYMQVPQPEPLADLILPIGPSSHRQGYIGVNEIEEFRL